MILEALNQYYETLCARGELSIPGWDDSYKVTYGLDISDDGEIIRLIDLREEQFRGKNNDKIIKVPKLMRVPAHEPRSNKPVPAFLCDNIGYLFGFNANGEELVSKKTIACFRAEKDLHYQVLELVPHPAAKAILTFFDHWIPEEAQEHPVISVHMESLLKGANLIFCYEGQPVTEIKEIQDAWQVYYDKPNPFTPKGHCLITGEIAPIATIHPKIKGVRDAQPSGASLVSFSSPAFCSYGKEQCFNAPVSERAAFAYTTALNVLLADKMHCRIVGDTTVICWAEHGDPVYQDAYFAAMFGSMEENTKGQLTGFLDCLASGAPLSWDGMDLQKDEHFYVLGISPNAARLSVRFFMKDTFGELFKNIQRHYEDIAIAIPAYDKYEHLPLWKLLAETVNEKSSNKGPSPILPGAVLRSILMGTPYPAALLNGVYQRIRADRKITRGRAAIIKAFYIRSNIPFPKEVLTMTVNESSSDIPYNLGRLFSIYEQIQEKALPNLNATIKDKYFSSASCTPAMIMPIINKTAQHHLRAIRRISPSLAYYFEDMIQKYSEHIGMSYPARLTMAEQGSFILGYYHQNHERYKSKSERTDSGAITDQP